ncbi:hypothetical protein GLOIN_2v1769254 [Rhizophagus clarus]|uniref:TLDc domain-containing protein n=1 Tax=Rhizophagus clarus TaxID=94130 RepID=A0A8H3LG25_9GLOM|nr:hypothetical protein GLOIN_2v1769254 [Rhizophagus clarus]
MLFENYQYVANDYEKLLESEKDYDVIIYASGNRNEEIHACSFVLRTRSRYFRFCYISPEIFVTKVYPFKEIMAPGLFNNMLLFHVAQNTQLNEDERPPRRSKYNVDSVIINQDHIKIFAKRICRKEKSSKYIPYKFNLLYRASRVGNTPESFHAKCDNKGATLLVIANSNQIAGGYNSLSWDITSGWKSTYDSFIFLFTDRSNLQSAKVSYSYGGAKSIGCHLIKGPTFGWNLNVHRVPEAEGMYLYRIVC